MLDSAIGIILIILSVNIVYVSLSTIRVILTLKGQKYIAAAIGTLEIMLYTVGLGLVLDNLDRIENLIAYGIGYGIGVIIGSKIEERLALGYTTVNVISSDPELNFTERLRENGYGVTSWYAYGMEGDRLSMQILTPRKYESHLYHTIKEIDPKAFIISYEPKQINGGFWVKKVKKGKIKRSVEQEETIMHVINESEGIHVSEETKERTLHKTDE
ncbi:Uncharacterized protein YebE, UPF0316 family [Halolactibacillus halophilus]|uniref:UPF0316 protein HHA03_14350 n=1 Tax=Halolactibacillus halophilus TaxID=306540 RepID=A0A1I5QSK6_9BACI|nr:DUF2179 domain-containing protein [Halolactibacillus halophilus]GEM01903.1 UPF0316 protein YebE [Halolactibacillus halophilus]SFP49235.1 Uncharacterized protein YebE, UPF0316 family [Halolactibacillus halophilus]